MTRRSVLIAPQPCNLPKRRRSTLALGMMLAMALPLIATPAAGKQAGNRLDQDDGVLIEEGIEIAQRTELLCDAPISMATISVADFINRNPVIVNR